MLDCIKRVCEDIHSHFEKLPNNWKSSVLDSFALPFIGSLIYRRDFNSAMHMGMAFSTTKAFSILASPYFTKSNPGRLKDSFLRGFTLRAILDRDLKRAFFGGSVFAFSEGLLIAVETVSHENLVPFFKDGVNDFASTTAATLCLEEGKESCVRTLIVKVICSGTKFATSSFSHWKTLLEAIDSVLNNSLQTLIRTRNLQEGVKEATLTAISFTAKRCYILCQKAILPDNFSCGN